MKWLALQGLKGGVGTTTVAAHLAVACQRQGRPVLLIDFSPGNLLRIYMGMSWTVRRGLLSALAGHSPWYQAAYRSSESVQFIPYGSDVPAHERYGQREDLRKLASRMRVEAEELHLPEDTLVIVDCPALNPSDDLLLQDLAELNLLVLNPEPACYASLRQQKQLAGCHVLINRLHVKSTLESDVQDLLMADSNIRVLPMAIQADEFVPESLAWKQTVFQAAPHSQAAHDFNLLATWIGVHLRDTSHAN